MCQVTWQNAIHSILMEICDVVTIMVKNWTSFHQVHFNLCLETGDVPLTSVYTSIMGYRQ